MAFEIADLELSFSDELIDLSALRQCTELISGLGGRLTPNERMSVVGFAQQDIVRKVGNRLLFVIGSYCVTEDGPLRDVHVFGTFSCLRTHSDSGDSIGLGINPLDDGGVAPEDNNILDKHGVCCLYEEVLFPICTGNNVIVRRARFEAAELC